MNQLAELVRHLTEDPDDPRVRLRRQLHMLESHIHRLGRDASRMGHAAAGNAGDLVDDALAQGTVAAKAVGQGLVQAGKTIGRDPLPLLVAIGTVALLARLARR